MCVCVHNLSLAYVRVGNLDASLCSVYVSHRFSVCVQTGSDAKERFRGAVCSFCVPESLILLLVEP